MIVRLPLDRLHGLVEERDSCDYHNNNNSIKLCVNGHVLSIALGQTTMAYRGDP